MTASEINSANSAGQFCWTGNRQRISKAAETYHGRAAKPAHVWVFLHRTGLWDEIPESAIHVDQSSAKADSKEQSMTKNNVNDPAPETHEETLLFEKDDEPIPHLEKKFKLQVDRQDRAKALSNEAKEYEAQCLTIMGDLNIKKYKRGAVRIFIKPGPPHVDGSID